MMWRYEPNSAGWVVIARGHTAVWLDVPVADARIDELWGIVAGPHSAADLVQLLSRDGLAQTPSFAIVTSATESASTTLLARGAVTIELRASAAEVIDASGYATWVERVVEHLNSVMMTVKEKPSGVTLPLGEGVVCASSVKWATGRVDSISDESVAASRADGARPKSSVIDLEATISPVEPSEQGPVSALIQPIVAPDLADAELPDASPQSSVHDELFGETVIRSIEDAAVRPEAGLIPPPPTPVAQSIPEHRETDDADHDGYTIFGDEVALLKEAGLDGWTADDQVQPPASLMLRSSAGEVIPLDRAVVIGRSPSVSRPTASGDLPTLITVAGQNPDVSRNHVQVVVEGGTVVVTDLHARNGTMCTLPGRAPTRLRPGEPTPVIIGSVIDLGGGATYTVMES